MYHSVHFMSPPGCYAAIFREAVDFGGIRSPLDPRSDADALLARPGKACVYVNQMADEDAKVLEWLVIKSVSAGRVRQAG
jgi:hypothetical protein